MLHLMMPHSTVALQVIFYWSCRCYALIQWATEQGGGERINVLLHLDAVCVMIVLLFLLLKKQKTVGKTVLYIQTVPLL